MYLKPIESMTTDEMKAEMRTHECLKNKGFAFISYAHRDEDKVYPIVLSWMRAGYNIYIDLDFEKHGSDSNWVSQMESTLGNIFCKLAICFRSTHYAYSYASLLELLTMRSNRIKLFHSNKSLNVDVLRLERVPDDAEYTPELASVYDSYYENNLRSTMGEKFAGHNSLERKTLQIGLKDWRSSMSRDFVSENSTFNDPEEIMQAIDATYKTNSASFFSFIALLVNTWFKSQNLNGNDIFPDTDIAVRFDQVGVQRVREVAEDPAPVPTGENEPSSRSGPVLVTENPEAKRRGRPPKSAQETKDASPTVETVPAPKLGPVLVTENPEAKRRGRPPKSAQETGNTSPKTETVPSPAAGPLPQITLGEIRQRFLKEDFCLKVQDLRKNNLPYGGMGAMDYGMAALLGGCNNVREPWQLNYYNFAIADYSKKKEGTKSSATWTWSSNCRKLLNMSGSGQIDNERNSYFASLPENTTLAEVVDCFRRKETFPFQTSKNDLIVDCLYRFAGLL